MHRFQTTAVHAGRDDFDALCVHAPPLDLSTTYPVADLGVGTESFDALVGGAASAGIVLCVISRRGLFFWLRLNSICCHRAWLLLRLVLNKVRQ